MATQPPLPTARDILTFHSLDRNLYDQVIAHGINPCNARNIVALWMWLEILGMHIVFHLNRHCNNRALVRQFIIEAETILDVIRPEATFPSNKKSRYLIPYTASLVREALDLKFFYCHCDVVVKGIAHVLDGVGRLVFDDELKGLLDGYRTSVNLARIEGRELPELPPALMGPYMARVAASAVEESSRSLFISFWKGNNLRVDDIVKFFSQ